MTPIRQFARTVLVLLALSASLGCVYEVDVQQGNKLEPHEIDAVEVGMSRSQVRYLLGTPVVNNLFSDERWDYVYYYKPGRGKKPERRWVRIWFDDNNVTQIERDVTIAPDPSLDDA